MTSIDKWMSEAGHLPSVLKDFHGQKAIFRAMHDLVDMSGNAYAQRVDHITGHTYVVDVFLWFMAKRGYTLQRSRRRLPFCDLNLDVHQASMVRREKMRAAMSAAPANRRPATQSQKLASLIEAADAMEQAAQQALEYVDEGAPVPKWITRLVHSAEQARATINALRDTPHD